MILSVRTTHNGLSLKLYSLFLRITSQIRQHRNICHFGVGANVAKEA